jgi:predicted phage-related endonuclease
MIEKLNLATKSEIKKEMEELETAYKERENALKEKMDEMRNFVQESDKTMRELSERYVLLKNEIDKREGKGV